MIERFPLTWPAGYPVTENRKQSDFKCTFVQARDGMINEFKLLLGSARDIIISCNMPHDKSGLITGKSPLMYPNPGVAVYFNFKGEQKVIACDHWKHLHENLRAIQYTVGSLRQMDRHKCTQILTRAMSEMKALPQNAGESVGGWWDVLGTNHNAGLDLIEAAYRVKAKYYHPDNKATGNTDMFKIVVQAYNEAKASKKGK